MYVQEQDSNKKEVTTYIEKQSMVMMTEVDQWPYGFLQKWP